MSRDKKKKKCVIFFYVCVIGRLISLIYFTSVFPQLTQCNSILDHKVDKSKKQTKPKDLELVFLALNLQSY